MSKVDWAQAEVEYVTTSKVSYDDIARMHKVAKSTVVRHAKKANWKIKRATFQVDRAALARKIRMESEAEIDDRHLKKLRMAQDIMNHEFMRLSKKLLTNGELDPRETRIVFDFIGPYTKAVMAERTILGLATKPTRITNPEDVDAYLEAIGAKEPSSVDRQYKETKSAIETLDQMIERRQKLQAYIDEVDERGSY